MYAMQYGRIRSAGMRGMVYGILYGMHCTECEVSPAGVCGMVCGTDLGVRGAFGGRAHDAAVTCAHTTHGAVV